MQNSLKVELKGLSRDSQTEWQHIDADGLQDLAQEVEIQPETSPAPLPTFTPTWGGS